MFKGYGLAFLGLAQKSPGSNLGSWFQAPGNIEVQYAILKFNRPRPGNQEPRLPQKSPGSNLGSWFQGPGNIEVQYVILKFNRPRPGNQEPRLPQKSPGSNLGSWFQGPGKIDLQSAKAGEPRTKIAPEKSWEQSWFLVPGPWEY